MEVIFCAVLGEVASRSFAFLIDKYLKEETVDEMLSLKLLLLRARVILEEADGRSITNQAMLQQLNMLRKEMYRGYYALDSFRGIQASEDKTQGHSVSHSFALSKFSPVKRLFFSTVGGTPCVKEVQQVSKNLATIIFHMDEFVAFLKNCPPRYRQPYYMHLTVGLSMFGRQMEMERVMNFLMQMESSIEQTIGVLPIIGSDGVGKSTLVAHIYNSEKVRDHFSQIVLVPQDDLKDNRLSTLKDRGLTIFQNNQLNNGNGRLLVIIELSEDVGEVAWKRLYVAYAGCLESGSKIIVTSRSSKIMNFGTTQALLLNTLPIEAFWYFFKLSTFGSADPEEHPKLQSIALQIAKQMNGSFPDAWFLSSFLGNSLDNAKLWRVVLTWFKAHVRRTSKWADDLVSQHKPIHFLTVGRRFQFVLYARYQTNSPHDMVPKITLHDVISNRAKPQGRFDALAYKSPIAPYNSYVVRCVEKN
ncbi:unnamed protein product [Urochloa decumbens]|uniref:NB-ARC domain-containing protein n=1 Tax=Urochloa decumbens TaxID=240449 RepID=A0ABC9FGJ0_9POAL